MANPTAPTTRPLFCVVYRTGGTANFTWHRTVAMAKDAAEALRVDTERGGYRAMVVNYDQSMRIGLPETFGEPLDISFKRR